jgi:hypothetical protein
MKTKQVTTNKNANKPKEAEESFLPALLEALDNEGIENGFYAEEESDSDELVPVSLKVKDLGGCYICFVTTPRLFATKEEIAKFAGQHTKQFVRHMRNLADIPEESAMIKALRNWVKK